MITNTTNPNRRHAAKRRLAAYWKLKEPNAIGLFYTLRWRLRRADVSARVKRKQDAARKMATDRKARRGGSVHGQMLND